MKVLLEGIQLPFARRIAALTAAATLAPAVYYLWARMSGALPSRDAWYAQGTNHGPWRWELPGLLLYFPILFVIPFTIIASLALATSRRNVRYLAAGAVLVPVQITCYVGLLSWLFWTID